MFQPHSAHSRIGRNIGTYSTVILWKKFSVTRTVTTVTNSLLCSTMTHKSMTQKNSHQYRHKSPWSPQTHATGVHISLLIMKCRYFIIFVLVTNTWIKDIRLINNHAEKVRTLKNKEYDFKDVLWYVVFCTHKQTYDKRNMVPYTQWFHVNEHCQPKVRD